MRDDRRADENPLSPTPRATSGQEPARTADLADAPPSEPARSDALGEIRSPRALHDRAGTGGIAWPRSLGGASEVEESLPDFLPEPYLVTDTFGTIRAANQATEELFGRPRYELIGRPLAVYVPLESRGQFRSALASLINAGEREQWRAALHVGGANRSVRLTVGVRRDQQGKAKYLRWLLQPASDGVTSSEAPRDDGGWPSCWPHPVARCS